MKIQCIWLGLAVLAAVGCGGSAAVGVASDSLGSIKSIVKVGPRITVAPNFFTNGVVFEGGHVLQCGFYGSAAAFAVDDVVTQIPPKLGGSSYSAKFVGGRSIYGSYYVDGTDAHDEFSYDIDTGQMKDLGQLEVLLASPSGTCLITEVPADDESSRMYIHHCDTGLDVALHLPANTILVPEALSDAGNGVGSLYQGSSDERQTLAKRMAVTVSPQRVGVNPVERAKAGQDLLKGLSLTLGLAYRWDARGELDDRSLTPSSPNDLVSFNAINRYGDIVGSVYGGPGAISYSGVWHRNQQSAVQVYGPDIQVNPVLESINDGGVAAGYYGPWYNGPETGPEALIWPNVLTNPMRGIDVNYQFGASLNFGAGLVLSGVPGFDPSGLRFVGQIAGSLMNSGQTGWMQVFEIR